METSNMQFVLKLALNPRNQQGLLTWSLIMGVIWFHK